MIGLGKARLMERDIYKLTVQLFSGLEYAHKLQVVHRDIKPQNLMLHGPLILVIIDWGIAKVKGHELEDEHVGTAMFWPPECYQPYDIDLNPARDCFCAMLVMLIVYVECVLGIPNSRVVFYNAVSRHECEFYGPWEHVYLMQATRFYTFWSNNTQLPNAFQGQEFSDSLRTIFGLCLKSKPEDRMSAKGVIQHMSSISNR